jgi:hypothetical protein
MLLATMGISAALCLLVIVVRTQQYAFRFALNALKMTEAVGFTPLGYSLIGTTTTMENLPPNGDIMPTAWLENEQPEMRPD